MMQDDRTNAEATAGLLQAPTSLVDQMDERHGKFSSRLGLFGHLLGGGEKSDYGDADLQAQHKLDKTAYDTQQARGLLEQQFEGLDMNNLSMADVATLNQLDPALGKQAMENFAFNQRVGDLGRADGFLNDGIDDENDLWATETYGRYGKTADGQQGSLDKVLGNASMTRADFEALPAETQRAVMYQHGTEDDRAAMDKVAGRQTLDQIEAEGAAKGIGEASGAQTAEAVGFLPNAPQIAKDQDYAIAGAQGVIDLIKGGDIDTGKWINMVKDTFNVQTKADGTLGYQATQALIQQINSATFGALSEREIETLEKMFANGSYNEEANLGVMEGVMGKLNHEKEKHGRKTQESIRRVKEFAPDEYEYFMEDDNNWVTYGDGAKIKAIPQLDANGNQMKGPDGSDLPEKTFGDFVSQFGGKYSRDELVSEWDKRTTAAQDAQKAREEMLKEQKKQADEALSRLTADPAATGNLSPYIARPAQ